MTVTALGARSQSRSSWTGTGPRGGQDTCAAAEEMDGARPAGLIPGRQAMSHGSFGRVFFRTSRDAYRRPGPFPSRDPITESAAEVLPASSVAGRAQRSGITV